MNLKRLLLSMVALLPSFYFSQTTITLSVSKDAAIGYHDGASTANNNYGTATHGSAFWIPSVAAPPPGVNANRALIDFSLGVIPVNATITSANLNLYAYGPLGVYSGHFGPNASYLERITQNWQEMVVTWNNQPTTTNQNSAILPQSSSPTQDYLNINVLNLVQDMISNPATSHGFMLKQVTELVDRAMFFCSNDHPDISKRPTLVVTYITCTGSVQISPSSSSVCSGNPAYLTGSGVSPANISWFSSQNPNQSIGSGSIFTTPVLTATSNPTVYTYYADNNLCGLRSTANITVNPQPQVSIQSSHQVICEGVTATLSAQGGASNFSWLQNAAQFSTFQTVVVSPSVTTIYLVNGSNSYNCTASSVFTLTVSRCVGIKSDVENDFDITVFPNPTNGLFSVAITNGVNSNCSLELLDCQGRSVKVFELNKEISEINGSDLASGIYICKVINKGQILQVKKLVIN